VASKEEKSDGDEEITSQNDDLADRKEALRRIAN
jgi:hypothetical protein